MSETKKAGKKRRRSAIVPRAVFAVAVAMGTAPTLSGCSSRPVYSVAAPLDMGHDASRDGSGEASSPDIGFSVAARDAGLDLTFSVAAPLDAGPDSFFSVTALPDATFSVAVDPDASFTVAAIPDATFSVAAPPPDAFFAVAVPGPA